MSSVSFTSSQKEKKSTQAQKHFDSGDLLKRFGWKHNIFLIVNKNHEKKLLVFSILFRLLPLAPSPFVLFGRR